MNENLDLCLILKDCPKDTKLYCTFLGDVLFSKIENNKIFVHIGNTEYTFYSDGKFIRDGERVLFPSREQRDFNLWKCGFETGEKLMIEKAVEWFKHQKEEIGISWFDDYEIRFRKAMEE